jgi:hypothetical protein
MILPMAQILGLLTQPLFSQFRQSSRCSSMGSQ